MTDLNELYKDLDEADRLGDEELAGAIAERIRAAPQMQPDAPQATPSQPQPTIQERAAQTLGLKDYETRGSILPMGRTKEGELELAMPQMGVDLVKSAMLPGHVAKGGEFSAQDVARFALDFGAPATQRTRMTTGRKVVPTRRQLVKQAQTGEQLREQAAPAYKAARQAGVVVGDTSYDNFIDDAEKVLRNEGYREKLYPQIKNVLDSWRGDREPAIDFTELEIYRKQLTDLRRSSDKSAQRLGEILTSKLDDYVDNIDVSDLTAGTADEARDAARALKTARRAYSRAKKVETIEDMVHNANQAASGFENGIVQEMRRITKRGSPSARKRIAGFSPEERKLMESIADQPTSQKILRFLGKMSAVRSDAGNLSGAMLGGGLGAYIGGKLAGPPGAMAGAMVAPTVGYVAQKAATANMNRRMDLLKAMAATGRTAGSIPAEQALRYQMLARGLGPLVAAGALNKTGGADQTDQEGEAARLKSNLQWLANGGI